tara:strand:+ start:23692 stop:24612 length:921 start_codon:yes stop_codon:yes gene_type:complete
MKIMVLGGNGFIGRNLLKSLHNTHEVVVLTKSKGHDLRIYSNISLAISHFKPDVIYNLASHGGSLHYVKENAAEVYSDNLLMALNLYKAVKEHAPLCRIIQPFSNCSYPGDSDIQHEENWLDGEVHNSVFSFGNSKRSIYYLSKCYAEQYNIKSINLLMPNTYGPYDSLDPNHTHALNGMIIRMLTAQKNGDNEFVVWGSGKPIREWIYVDDFINALKQAMDINVGMEYPVNVGQERGYSIAESANMIADSINFEGNIVFDTTKTDGDPVKILSNKNFNKLFPNFDFYNHKKGIDNTVAYYKEKLF